MIITQKQFPNYKKYEIMYEGRPLSMEVGKMAESGNALAKQVWEAFFYQIAKDAGAMAAVLHGKVDQIILTGGIAYNPFTAKTLTEYLGWIAPVTTYPGEDELLALCQGALRVMTGEEEAKNY